MSDYTRYAIFYMPAPGPLAAFGAAWLGWDAEAVAYVEQPSVPGLEAATATPRKYGFHGTLKAPFRLAEGCDATELEAAAAVLAARTAPVCLDALVPDVQGQFLALVPQGPAPRLGELAGQCVADLDDFRAPLTEMDLVRRRNSGLSARQDALLVRWGYPHVMDQFRFHMTLTGRLDPPVQGRLRTEIDRRLPELPRPFVIDQIVLAAERRDGQFVILHRYPLSA